MRDERFLLLQIIVMVIVLVFSGCQKKVADNSSLSLPQPSVTPQLITSSSPISEATPIYKSYSSIRTIDFKNFNFPWTEGQELDKKWFTLIRGKKESSESEKEGEMENGARFGSVEFGDVTNDRIEEAMVQLYPITGGNCSCEMIYIYAVENKKPKLLWSFDTEDRASGGFKRAYSEKGNLVIETFGDNKFENGKWDFRMPKDKPSGLCCPTAYTKIVFKWNGEKFVPTGERQVFDYDWRKKIAPKD